MVQTEVKFCMPWESLGKILEFKTNAEALADNIVDGRNKEFEGRLDNIEQKIVDSNKAIIEAVKNMINHSQVKSYASTAATGTSGSGSGGRNLGIPVITVQNEVSEPGQRGARSPDGRDEGRSRKNHGGAPTKGGNRRGAYRPIQSRRAHSPSPTPKGGRGG